MTSAFGPVILRRVSDQRPKTYEARALQWFSAPLGSRTVPVYLSCPALTRCLKGHDGYIERSAHGGLDIVWINCTIPRAAQDLALYHELCGHAVLWACSPPLRNEEAVVTALEPAWRILRRLGFKWPPRPRGIGSLERYARKGDES